MADKPDFDPSKPFDAAKPAFDPSLPFSDADAPKADDVSVAGDIAKSGGIGLAKGAIGLAGLPGDMGTLLGKGVDYVGGKLGASPETVRGVKDTAKTVLRANPITSGAVTMAEMPGAQDIQKGIESQTGEFYKPKTTAGEYAQTVGEFAPAAIGGPETLLGRIGSRVVLPALASETAGQVTKGTAAEPYARAAGALASPALIAGARRAITPLATSPERQALAATLEAEGVPITAGQRTGNKPLQWMESALGDTPGAGAPAHRMMENQAERFTSAALRRAGIDADRATPEVMDNAFNRIGNDFESIAQRNHVLADGRLGHDLGTVQNEYNNVVSPSNRAPVIENTANDIVDAFNQNGGHLTGEQYNAFTSRLARQARGAQADPQLQEALHGVRGALDDAMERTLFRTGNNADMQLIRQARRQYRNMMVLEKAATGAGSNAAEGLISPSQLRNAVVQQSRRAYGRGQGDFANLARSGEALLKPLPNSGTSPRSHVTHMMQTIGAVVGGGAGSAAGPGGTALGAAAGLAAPAVAGRALLSRPVQAYLGNQLLPGGGQGMTREQALRSLLLSIAPPHPDQAISPPNR